MSGKGKAPGIVRRWRIIYDSIILNFLDSEISRVRRDLETLNVTRHRAAPMAPNIFQDRTAAPLDAMVRRHTTRAADGQTPL